ncbi:MAG TPA: glycosyltransferase [Burkholderiales bacterium]|nr:glycosyltransferase [Burkholderiales bacterium]
MAQQASVAAGIPSNGTRESADEASCPLLSVVVPVYNGVPFLPRLLESLRAQQGVPDQLIFVDDGSTDGSSDVIARLASGLAGLRIIRQKNQGQAVARNVGMREATGRYLAFLDVDDEVDAGMYAKLVGLAEEEQLDIAMGNAWNFHEGRKPDTLVYRDVPDTGVITGEAWFQQRWLSRYLPHYCWMHVYRRSFIDRHGFVFPPAEPHEDVIWVTETLLAARRFHFIPLPFYRYRKKLVVDVPLPALGPGGNFRRDKGVEASLYNARALSEIARRETLQPLTQKLMRREFVNSGAHVVRHIGRLPDFTQRTHYLKRIREERFFRILWSNAAGLSQYWRVLRYHLFAYVLALVARFST